MLITDTLKIEKNRIEYMISQYKNKLLELPKGSVSTIDKGNKTYYYLKYRDGDKVISKYVSERESKKVISAVEERRHIEKMIKELEKELKFADKALEITE